jgi:hypothetical protein
MATQKDPVYLVSVNTTPDVARVLLAKLLEVVILAPIKIIFMLILLIRVSKKIIILLMLRIQPVGSSKNCFEATILTSKLCSAIEGVETLLLSLTIKPQLLVSLQSGLFELYSSYFQICSSQWTPEQQVKVQDIAIRTIPGIKTAAIPAGLNAMKGGEAVVEWLKKMVYDVGIPRRA